MLRGSRHWSKKASSSAYCQLTLLNNYGVFSLNTGNGTGAARTTNGLSDFMAGIPTTMNQDTPLYANANYWSYGCFAQDDWRILPNLTVNVGLRYDFQQAPTDNKRMQTNFTPGVQSHAFNNVKVIGLPQTVAPIGMLFPGVPKGGVFSPINHVSPRVGFAFDPNGNGKTVIHGAADLFFGGIAGNLWEHPSAYSPYAVRSSLFRDFNLHRDVRFQFRGEVRNVLNLTNLGTPAAALNSANAGKVLGTGGDNRIIRVGGRILF